MSTGLQSPLTTYLYPGQVEPRQLPLAPQVVQRALGAPFVRHFTGSDQGSDDPEIVGYKRSR